MKNSSFLTKCSWTLVAYTVLIILWGAWVRISGSGAGCGEHWPKCHGALIPENATVQTWIEFIHRAKSGVFGVLVLAFFFIVRSIYPKHSLPRTWVSFSLFFTITEALLGAALVLFGLVDKSQSPWRALVMPLHLTNTLALLGSLVLLSHALGGYTWKWSPLPPVAKRSLLVAIAAFLLVASSGALAALSTQLFPTTDLLEGLAKDLSADTPLMERMRIVHIPFALLGIIACLQALRRFSWLTTSTTAHRALEISQIVAFIAVLFGAATLISLSPVWMKIVHLFLMNLLWISVVSTSAICADRFLKRPN